MEFHSTTYRQNKHINTNGRKMQTFSEIDEDLRRIGERELREEMTKPLCAFGDRCYRKNEMHFKQYRHVSDQTEERKKNNVKVESKQPKGKITDFFHRTPNSQKNASYNLQPKEESDYEIDDTSDIESKPSTTLSNASDSSNKVSNNKNIDNTSSKRRKLTPNRNKTTNSTNRLNKGNKKGTTSNHKNISIDNDSDDDDLNFKLLLNTKFKKKSTSPLDCSDYKQDSDNKTTNSSISTFFKPKPLQEEENVELENRIDNNWGEQSSKHLDLSVEQVSSITRKAPKPKLSPKQLNELIKDIFLLEMPNDFFYLWQFCKTLNREKPEDALFRDLDLRLVGAYDILTGKVKKCFVKDNENILCHWRYYYDPPEFQTLIARDKDGYHLGYFRDTPEHENPVVVSNNADKSCAIEGIADNLLAAIYSEIQKRKSGKCNDDKGLVDLEIKLKEYCARNKIDLRANSNLRARKSKTNAPTFHSFGIVVPVSGDNNVGYRQLPDSDTNLKKLFTRISNLDVSDRTQTKAYKDLQQMIACVNYANDECDFGMGLEFGIDLFCTGDPFYHNNVEFLLSTAYSLLNRDHFATIIKAHINYRRKGNNLSAVTV